MDLVIHPFFEPVTSSFSYVLANPGSGFCAVVDPVLDYDPERNAVSTGSADCIAELVSANDYQVEWILDTHVHADHLSAARYLKQRFVCAQMAIGEGVREVQRHFAKAFEVNDAVDGRQFDRLLGDGERLSIGRAGGRVWHTPGHTPACVSYVFDQLVVVGDTLFVPDYGTARCDFPGGDPAALFRSVQRYYTLPDDARLLLCHDYPADGRAPRFWTRVGDQKRGNVMLPAHCPESQFVAARRARDRKLTAPRLMVPAVRANIAGGVLPGWQLEPHLFTRQEATAVDA